MLSKNSFNNQSIKLNRTELEFIIDQAVQHNVANLVASAFNSEFVESIPDDIFERVNELSRAEVIKTMYLVNELSELNKKFNSEDLEFILLKGPALGVELYGDLTLRQFNDLDLLVRREDLDATVNLLIERGYRYFFELTDRQRKLYENSSIYLIDHDMHYSFFHPETNIFVEVHWSLMPDKYSFVPTTDELFSGKKKINIDGNNFNSLNDEDLIIFLSLHGIKHGWSRLFWLCDIVRFLTVKNSIDWAGLVKKAETLNCIRSLFVALNISEFILPGLLKEDLSETVKNGTNVKRISELIRKNLFINDYRLELTNKDKIFVDSMERYTDKIRVYTDKLFRPTIYEVELIRLPKQIMFIYYIIRPIRLFIKHTTRFLSG